MHTQCAYVPPSNVLAPVQELYAVPAPFLLPTRYKYAAFVEMKEMTQLHDKVYKHPQHSTRAIWHNVHTTHNHLHDLSHIRTHTRMHIHTQCKRMYALSLSLTHTHIHTQPSLVNGSVLLSS